MVRPRFFLNQRTAFQAIVEKVKLGQTELVSFDVFDTLVHRRIAPEAIPRRVASKLEVELETRGALKSGVDVLNERQAAYVELISEKVNSGLDLDVSLELIVPRWIEACASRDLDERLELTREIIEYEGHLESVATYPSPWVHGFLRTLRELDVRLVYASDMYLGYLNIQKLLESHDLGEFFEAGYVSGDFSLLKRTGRLFDKIVELEGKKPKQICHVGDDPVADGFQAASRGIAAFVVSDPTLEVRNSVLKKAFGSLSTEPRLVGKIVAEFARCAPREVISREEAYGRRFLGPVFANFVHQVAEKANELELDAIYFASREGHVLIKLFAQLFDQLRDGSRPALDVRYLEVSRLVTLLSACGGFSLRSMVAVGSNSSQVTIRSLLSPFGLEPDLIYAFANSAGAPGIDENLPGDWRESPYIIRLAENPELAKEINQRSSQTKEKFHSYLRDKGFFSHSRVGFVDVGWGGQIQDNLFSSIQSEPARPEIFGLYLGVNRLANSRSIVGSRLIGLHADESRLEWEPQASFRFPWGLEASIRAPHGTVVGYTAVDARVTPIYRGNDDPARLVESQDDPKLALVQKGILDFGDKYRSAQELLGFESNGFQVYANSSLDQLVRFPRADELQILGSVTNISDQGSSVQTPILHPGKKVASFAAIRQTAEWSRSLWTYGAIASVRPRFIRVLVVAFLELRDLKRNLHNGSVNNLSAQSLKPNLAGQEPKFDDKQTQRGDRHQPVSVPLDQDVADIDNLHMEQLSLGLKLAESVEGYKWTKPITFSELFPSKLARSMIHLFQAARGRQYFEGKGVPLVLLVRSHKWAVRSFVKWLGRLTRNRLRAVLMGP